MHDDESVDGDHVDENIDEQDMTAEEIHDIEENERIREEILHNNEAQQGSNINVLNPIDKYFSDDLYQDTGTLMDTMPQHRYSTRSKVATHHLSKTVEDGLMHGCVSRLDCRRQCYMQH